MASVIFWFPYVYVYIYNSKQFPSILEERVREEQRLAGQTTKVSYMCVQMFSIIQTLLHRAGYN